MKRLMGVANFVGLIILALNCTVGTFVLIFAMLWDGFSRQGSGIAWWGFVIWIAVTVSGWLIAGLFVIDFPASLRAELTYESRGDPYDYAAPVRKRRE